MYKRILLAYDGSDEGRGALSECGDLAVLLNAQVHLRAVSPSYAGLMVAEGMIVEDNYDHERKRFEDVLDEGIASLRARGYSAEGQVAHGEPVDEICARAKE